jgi:hypothetical protein
MPSRRSCSARQAEAQEGVAAARIAMEQRERSRAAQGRESAMAKSAKPEKRQ